MATIAAMPPTPQQSFTHMLPAASPQGHQPSSQPNGMPAYGHSHNLSFDSQHSQPMFSQGQPSFSQSFPNGPISNPGYARSFGEGYGAPRGYGEKPQIYTVSRGAGQSVVRPMLICSPRRYTPAYQCTKWIFKASLACAGATTAGSTLLRY